jgi:hypothetical protein
MLAAVVTVVAIGASRPALAQAPPPAAPVVASAPAPATGPLARVFVSGDGGAQTTSSGFTAQSSFTLYAENATFTSTTPSDHGAVAALRGGYRIWRSLIVGVGVTGFWSKRPVDVTASLPHPFYFARPRSVDGSASGLARDEMMAALECSWLVPFTSSVDMQLFAGPAYFRVRADLPTRVQFAESYPYDAANFTSIETSTVSDSAAGFTVGADVTWMFSRAFGVGGHARFSRATATLTPPAGQSMSMTLGGFQAGGGLRIRF